MGDDYARSRSASLAWLLPPLAGAFIGALPALVLLLIRAIG
jgi:hypothetical protein